MFTPQHARPAHEMLRVVRSGGRIGLANSTPEGFIGQLFKIIGAYVPPPAGLKSPALWGTQAYTDALFGAQAQSIRCERRMFNFRYRTAEHWLHVFRDYYGPTHKAFAALGPSEQTKPARDITRVAGSSEYRRQCLAGGARGVPRSGHRQALTPQLRGGQRRRAIIESRCSVVLLLAATGGW